MAKHQVKTNKNSGGDMSDVVQKTDTTVTDMDFIKYTTGTIGPISAETGSTPVVENITVTGAKVGDCVILNFPNDSSNGLIVGQPYVSAVDTVTIEFGCGDETNEVSSMSSATYQCMVFRKTV